MGRNTKKIWLPRVGEDRQDWLQLPIYCSIRDVPNKTWVSLKNTLSTYFTKRYTFNGHFML